MKKLENIRKTIVTCATEYKRTFSGKNYIHIYECNKSLYHIESEFLNTNYLHLTGIKTKLKPEDFFQQCVDNKISIRDIELKKDGTTELKISVLPSLKHIISCNALIGDYEQSHRRLIVDTVLGDAKKLMTIGFSLKDTGYYVPQTLLKEDVKGLSNQLNKVVAVYSKSIDESFYNNCTFICKGTESLKIEEYIRSVSEM